MKLFITIFLCMLIWCIPVFSFSQDDSSTVDEPEINKKRLTYLLAGEASLYGITMVGLNQLWYKDYPRSSFHFFDDGKEWLQVDKMGHFYSAYYLGAICSYGFRWTGIDRKRSALWGGGLGMVFISSIEIFDGFSEKWGASTSDFISNVAGFGLYAGQEYLWQDQRIVLKYSFNRSDYAKYRPDALGKSFTEMLVKDYNGITIWMSGNFRALTTKEFFPSWLDLSFGYGADRMIAGVINPAEIEGEPVDFKRVRQYYLSFDIDLARIKTGSKLLNTIFECVNVVKIPLPTLELSDKKLKFHALYF